MGKDFSNELSSVFAGGTDTIVARATPGGRGALAIVRLSGRQITLIVQSIFAESPKLVPWKATLVDVQDSDGTLIEKAVVLFYRGPRSFTGEDMLEIMIHGSSYLVSEVVRACVCAGAREANPGEFTRRAVINGKIDLVQAEGIRDMIEAETRWQARLAREQINGSLSEQIIGLREALIGLLALIEVGLDFSDGEKGVDTQIIDEARNKALRLVEALLAHRRMAENIRDGLRIVIVGRPNAGKSTLFNRLVEDERAIVSPHAGTTRDIVEASIEISGISVTLVDTAGLRETSEAVEAEGVKRARSAIAEADCVVLLWSAESDEEPPLIDTNVDIIRVLTKTDLRKELPESDGWLRVSAVSGDGIDLLVGQIKDRANCGLEDFGGKVAIASRHRQALIEAHRHVSNNHQDLEVEAEEIRWALRRVEDLIGQTDNEDLFDEVFSGFCIGK